jgi:hypothetical protein
VYHFIILQGAGLIFFSTTVTKISVGMVSVPSPPHPHPSQTLKRYLGERTPVKLLWKNYVILKKCEESFFFRNFLKLQFLLFLKNDFLESTNLGGR